ncbi:MAG: DNA-processing protein DprA [Oscillospiraceae bacterium]|nr:DNA-processing protein DprA [Oscillospiraceae bacterium]
MEDQQTIYEKPELLRYWVWLSLVFGAGCPGLTRYIHDYGSPEALYDAMQAGRLRELPLDARKGMAEHTVGEADSIVYYCRTHEIALVPIVSPFYPEELRRIPAPPILLTARGNIGLLKHPRKLAIVGTRKPSPYTEEVTAAMIAGLKGQEIVIVSGFAKGIDAIAHTMALDSGLPTIGVLGCGINVNYPRENMQLRDRMLTSGRGLFLSEYMPGVQPFPANFPKRNRILSGLCYASAVMEAASRSGSLVTARCALEQGRQVLCVPPADLFDARYAGVIPFLREGAAPLMSPDDLLSPYDSYYPPVPSEAILIAEDSAARGVPLRYAETITDEITANEAAETFQRTAGEPAPQPENRPQPEPEPEKQAPLPDDPQERAIVEYLRVHGDTHADDIAAALDMDLSELLNALLSLEIQGYVESLFGKQYRAFAM